MRAGPAGGELGGEPYAPTVRCPAPLEAGCGARSREAPVHLVDAQSDDPIGQLRSRCGVQAADREGAAAD